MIAQWYLLIYKEPISQTKLHLVLYFAFIEFAQYRERYEWEDLPLELFASNFKISPYGFFDEEVEEWRQSDVLNEDWELPWDRHVRGKLLILIQQAFNTSDFGLIDLSHDDPLWKEGFKSLRSQKLEKPEGFQPDPIYVNSSVLANSWHSVAKDPQE